MKKSIMCVCVTIFTVTAALLFIGCEDSASPNYKGYVDEFLVRVNEKPGSSGGGSGSYQVTIKSEGDGASGNGANIAGAEVRIYAGTRPVPHWFEKWTSNKNVTFANPNSATTTFIMPASDVTVTAVFWTFSGWGTFNDARGGGKTYKTITIKGKKWMAENLNYTPSSGNSWCYGNSTDSCNKYGRLYDWETAKTVCPSGWHLPTRREWGDLAILAGGTGDYGETGTGGKILKATSGWKDGGNGTDEMGFSALPGGRRVAGGNFYNAGDIGCWWTATEYGSGYAYGRGMGYDYDDVEANSNGVGDGISVRCRED